MTARSQRASQRSVYIVPRETHTCNFVTVTLPVQLYIILAGQLYYSCTLLYVSQRSGRVSSLERLDYVQLYRIYVPRYHPTYLSITLQPPPLPSNNVTRTRSI